MTKPGDVVTVDFPGVEGIKRRPAVVVSTNSYHVSRPDVILSLLTTNLKSATAATDYVLKDWQSAGLHNPTAYRTFLTTMPSSSVTVIGHLTDYDWKQVQSRLSGAIAVQ